MTYHPFFYYKQKTSKGSFTRIPQAVIAINELIKNKPYWKLINPASEQKKKTLILSDWTAIHWSDRRRRLVREKLSQLLDDQFRIYVWQDGQLVCLTKEALYDLPRICQKITPVFPNQLIQEAAVQHRLQKDQILILDDHWMRHLIDGESAETRYLNTADFTHKDYNKEKLIAITQQMTPKLAGILDTELSPKGRKALKNMREILPDLPIVKKYLTLTSGWLRMPKAREDQVLYKELTTLSELDLFLDIFNKVSEKDFQLLLTHADKLKQLYLSPINFRYLLDLPSELVKSRLQYLESFTLECYYSKPKGLQNIISNLPALKTLHLKYADFSTLLTQPSPASLDELHLHYCEMDNEGLSCLLANSPSLRTLHLSGCTFDEPFQEINLTALENLSFTENSSSIHVLGVLLNKTSSLKKLDLYNCSFQSKLIGKVNLNSLQALHLDGSNLSLENLGHLIADSFSLRELSLQSCGNLAEGTLPEPLNLPHLEQLNLQRTAISFENLVNLISYSAELKELLLNYCKNLSESASEKLELLGLEVLDLWDSNISATNLYALIYNAPLLKILILSRCTNLSSTEIEKLNLPSVQEILLEYTNISSENLQSLLSSAPQLKKLKLLLCRNLLNDFSEPLNLSVLEELDLRESTISIESLGKLLANASRLKRLYLAQCKNLNGSAIDCLNLSSLEELDLSGSTISIENIYSLINKSLGLKKLKLYQCRKLDSQNVKLKPLNLPSIKEINLEEGRISHESLRNLLNSAPNLEKLNLNQTKIFDEKELVKSSWKKFKNLIRKLKNKFFSYSPQIPPRNLSIESLKSIDLNGAQIPMECLRDLLLSAKNLEEINFDSIHIKGKEINENFEKIKLESVEKLSLQSNNQLSMQTIANLINDSETLKELDLSGCLNLNGRLNGNLNLPALETLHLTGSNISAENATKLINNAPNLKKIYLNLCENLQEGIDWPASMPNLETLSLEGSNISSNSFIKLISSQTLPESTKINFSITRELLKNPRIAKLIEAGEMIISSEGSSTPSCNPEHKPSRYANYKPKTSQGFTQRQSKFGRFALNSAKNFFEFLAVFVIVFFVIVLSPILLVLAVPVLFVLAIKKLGSLWSRRKPLIYLPVEEQHNEVIENELYEEEEENMVSYFFKQETKTDFKFEGKNRTLNQGMIIEKLSQYLKLTNQYQNDIPALQNGICTALSHWDLARDSDETASILQAFRDWDGQKENLTNELTAHFHELFSFIKTYQTRARHQETYFCDNIVAFLQQNRGKLALNNPWHCISVKYNEADDDWSVYDPNFVNGPAKTSWEELGPLLKKTLGTLIGANTAATATNATINDPDAFIRDGGLLALCYAANYAELKDLLLPAEKLSDAALDGLLLRDIQAYPAWAYALKNKQAKEYTQTLIQQFILRKPDYEARLQKSIQDLSPKRKIRCLKLLQELKAVDAPAFEGIAEAMSQVCYRDYFASELDVSIKEKNQNHSLTNYCQKLTRGTVKKRLIELSSTDELQALRFALEKQCQTLSRPVFYVDSPDDLICSSPFMKREGTAGRLVDGPGGPLFDFLQAHNDKNNPPILIVNYENFDANDIVRFIGLLEKSPHADGTPLPENLALIGLTNTGKIDCYQETDFYSRFGERIERCPLTTDLKLPRLSFLSKDENHDCYKINLFHGADWQEQLLGRWIIKGANFYFKKGLLQKAIDSGLPLEIQNGLWEDAKFQQFWQQLSFLGYIDHLGLRIHCPQALRLIRTEGYDWCALTQNLQYELGVKPGLPVLNPSLLSSLFCQYHCDNEQQTLETLSGLLKAHANQVLELNLTRSLDEDEWGRLLTIATKYGVKLCLHCAPRVPLLEPQQEQFKLFLPDFIQNLSSDSKSTDLVIASADIDSSVAHLTAEADDWQVIDVSECDATDLLMYMDARLNKEALRFEFKEIPRALINALASKKKVLLKGQFSPALSDALAPLLLERIKDSSSKGRLVIVSDNPNDFSYFPNQQQEHVDVEMKKELLKRHFTEAAINQPKKMLLKRHFIESAIDQLKEKWLQKEPLSQLIARLDYCLLHPDEPSKNSWQGMESLTMPALRDFDPATSAEESKAFILKRLEAIHFALKNAPYVFLTGLTGVGKSTFVEKYLQNENTVLYQGEANLKDWALDESEQMKLLFIDEANLSSRQWSEFEGLFNNPPGILIDGTYFPLTEKHKVIYAGNPLSYGDERQAAPLFKRHGNALVFDLMPLAFIHEEILKPTFNGSELSVEEQTTVSQALLKLYQFVASCSKKEVLISPRDLEMMALLTLAHLQQNPNASTLETAQYYVYHLVKHRIPKAHQFEFTRQFAPRQALRENKPPSNSKFLTTDSRKGPRQLLTDLLALREFKRHWAENDNQRYGGLGGVILEGEPGIGKTELVMDVLQSQGFERVYLSTTNLPEKAFYYMPISMQLADKEKLLLKAFHEGVPVIVDEINGSVMMERLLNALLMGETLEGERPAKPGFMMIGTQNPISMAGRILASNALERRLIKVSLNPYSETEMEAILRHKGVPESYAKDMVEVYQDKQDLAAKNNELRKPCFRNLELLADKMLNAGMFNHVAAKKAPEQRTLNCKQRFFKKEELDKNQPLFKSKLTA